MVTALVLFGASFSSYAINYTLNATFSDDSTVTGTLTWVSSRDDGPGGISHTFKNVSITTTSGGDNWTYFSGVTYTCTECTLYGLNKNFPEGDRIIRYDLYLKFNSDLISEGGSIDLTTDSYEYSTGVKNTRYIKSGSITEVVATPEALLNELAGLVMEINIASGISNALDSKLDSALRALDDNNENNDGAALNSMYAFCNSIQAQAGKKLSGGDANTLIDAANSIINSLDEYVVPCENYAGD